MIVSVTPEDNVSGEMLALGIMTGTALDGFVDVAMIRTDGEEISDLLEWELVPLGAPVRDKLAAAVRTARSWGFEGAAPDLRRAESLFTDSIAGAVRLFLCKHARRHVDVVGMHGFTVLHRRRSQDAPAASWQIGDGSSLSRELGRPVAYDFRSADIYAGGEGAPVAPVYHAALLRKSGIGAPCCVLNLGGVANLTWWGGENNVAAFDAGPANGPLNEWTEALGLGPFDRDGTLALSGAADEGIIQRALLSPYFAASYPKSLDRYDFSCELVRGLSAADGAATLTGLVGAAVNRGLDLLPTRPARLVVCGGGRKNPAIMRAISARARVVAQDCDTLGWRGDAIEAEAFAYLAARRLRNLPSTFAATTGVETPTILGRLSCNNTGHAHAS